MLLAWAAQQGGLYSGYALALDFKNGVYRSASGFSSLSSLPGYAYSRAGAKIEAKGAAAVNFAANVPGIVPGLGGYFRAAATNLLLQSQAFDDATWGKVNLTAPAPVVTANAAIAPDGTLTADQIVYPAVAAAQNSNVHQSVNAVAGTSHTFQIWLRGAVGGENVYLYASPNGSIFVGATRLTLTNLWQIFSITAAPTTTTGWFWSIGTDARDGSQAPTAASTVFAWQAGLVAATNTGPGILTTNATATAAADALSVNLANGNYSAIYTFDNGTTQTIPTTIGAGTFAMPIYPATLNRPLVQSVTLK